MISTFCPPSQWPDAVARLRARHPELSGSELRLVEGREEDLLLFVASRLRSSRAAVVDLFHAVGLFLTPHPAGVSASFEGLPGATPGLPSGDAIVKT